MARRRALRAALLDDPALPLPRQPHSSSVVEVKWAQAQASNCPLPQLPSNGQLAAHRYRLRLSAAARGRLGPSSSLALVNAPFHSLRGLLQIKKAGQLLAASSSFFFGMQGGGVCIRKISGFVKVTSGSAPTFLRSQIFYGRTSLRFERPNRAFQPPCC